MLLAIFITSLLGLAFGKLQSIAEPPQSSPGSKWILQLAQHIQQSTEGTLDVELDDHRSPANSAVARVLDRVRKDLSLMGMVKHESTLSKDGKDNVLYVLDGTDVKRVAKRFRRNQTNKPAEYCVIVVNAEFSKGGLVKTYHTKLLLLDISRDPPRVQRVSPVDQELLSFPANASLGTILDDRGDWRTSEVRVMYSPEDPPFALTLKGIGLTGLDIELCRTVFDHAGMRYRFVPRPPHTDRDFAKYRASVIDQVEKENVQMIVSSVAYANSFSFRLFVYDKQGCCLLIPRTFQRNVIYHLVHPFEYNVWLLIGLLLLLDVLLICLFPRAFPHNLILILLFGDSLVDHEQTRPTRFYCFSCTILLFLLSEAYLAKAIIYMTVTRYTPDLKILADVYDSGIQFKVPQGGISAMGLRESQYERLSQQTIEDPNFRYDMADDRYGYMASCRYGEYLIQRHIQQDIFDFGQRNAKRKFYLLDEIIIWEFRYYVIGKHFTFYEHMNLAVNWLYEAGLWDRWNAIFRQKSGYDTMQYRLWDEDDILALEDILAIWYLYAIGLGVSSLVFLLETVVYIGGKKCCAKQDKKRRCW